MRVPAIVGAFPEPFRTGRRASAARCGWSARRLSPSPAGDARRPGGGRRARVRLVAGRARHRDRAPASWSPAGRRRGSCAVRRRSRRARRRAACSPASDRQGRSLELLDADGEVARTSVRRRHRARGGAAPARRRAAVARDRARREGACRRRRRAAGGPRCATPSRSPSPGRTVEKLPLAGDEPCSRLPRPSERPPRGARRRGRRASAAPSRWRVRSTAARWCSRARSAAIVVAAAGRRCRARGGPLAAAGAAVRAAAGDGQRARLPGRRRRCSSAAATFLGRRWDVTLEALRTGRSTGSASWC